MSMFEKNESWQSDSESADIVSLKHAFPFRLATTSYIFPAGYADNVARLGSLVDEIELLFFESRTPDACPNDNLIQTLGRQAKEHDLTYNIHLPIDIDPGSLENARRHAAVRVLKRFVHQTLPLNPTSFTLHLPYTPNTYSSAAIQSWRASVAESMSALMDGSFDPALICVENLDYPFEWVADLVERFDLQICFDVGHLLVQGQSPESFFRHYRDRIKVVHLHGVQDQQDHLSLDRFDPAIWQTIRSLLEPYRNTVSLEVFSYPDLKRSLEFLNRSSLRKPAGAR